MVVAAGRVPAEQLGELPDHVTVHHWVSQAELLPLVDGGAPRRQRHHPRRARGWRTAGAVAPGRRPVRQRRTLDAAGVAARLLPEEVNADAVAEQAHGLLPQHGNAEQRDAARVVAEEIAAMPSPATVAGRLPEYAA